MPADGGAVTSFDWFNFVREGGAYVAPLLLGAVVWMNAERARLLRELKESQGKVEILAERVIVLATEVKALFFNGRRAT